MKLKTIIATILIGYASAYGQVAHWVIPMDYDELRVEEDGHIVTGIIGDKTHIFNDTGNPIKEANANDVVHPYREGRAVATLSGTDQITAVYTDDGKFYHLENNSFRVAYNLPYFYDGFLLAKDKDLFCYISRGGLVSGNRFFSAYPYSHGFAACRAYNKKNYCTYLDNEGNEVPLIIKGKRADIEDIEFVSSINDELQGIVVVKGDVFFFDAQNRELKPLYGKTVEKGKQRQAEVKDKNIFITVVNDTPCLTAKTKFDDIYVFFDSLMTPTSIINANDTTFFKKNVLKKKEPMSKLKIIKDEKNDSLGLTYEGKEFLPPQFNKIRILEKDKALVSTGVKWGIMEVIPNFNLGENIKINDGKVIGFRHKEFNSRIRVDLPNEISAYKTTIWKAGNSGMHDINLRSIVAKDTEHGNYMECDCTLDIPEEIADTLTTIEYPIRVEYDKFHSPVIALTPKVWHVKYINATINQEKALLENGDYTFDIDVTVNKDTGEGDTKFDVLLEADTLETQVEYINIYLHKGIIKELPEGNTIFYVVIQEEGCPQTVVPFEVEYHKPKRKDDTPPNKQVRVRQTRKSFTRRRPESKPPKPDPIYQIDPGI